MNREKYYSIIDEKLSLLSLRITRNSSLNLLNLNIHCENFYAHLFNLIFGYNFTNANNDIHNFESIDLIDNKNQILAQVSSTSTKKKIESTLDNEKLKSYKDYRFIFIFISNKDTDNLRSKTFMNPYNVSFNPKTDIYDVKRLLSDIMNFNIEKQKEIYEFIKKELIPDLDVVKINSDLVKIINILSKEDFTKNDNKLQTLPFEIQKKIDFNGLAEIRDDIYDFAIYSEKLNNIYREFDKQGINKSLAILNSLKTIYIKNINNYSAPIQLFYKVIEETANKVKNEISNDSMSSEEIDLYVKIIVVDAFMKCKIFKNPEANNASSK